jgi:hypothetical protein
MCSAIPSVVVSHFVASNSRFIIKIRFKFCFLPAFNVFISYFVLFFCSSGKEFPTKFPRNFAKQIFPPFFSQTWSVMYIMVLGWAANQNAGFVIIIIIQWSIPGECFSIPIYSTNSYIKIPIYSVYLKSICLWDQ